MSNACSLWVNPKYVNSASTAMYSAVTPGDSLNPWMQHSQYDGPTPSGSPSAFSTPPPPEVGTPPQLSLGMGGYAPQTEHGYEWSQHISVAGGDGGVSSMDNMNTSYGHFGLDDSALHMQDYNCGLEHSHSPMYSEATSCGVESSSYSLSDDINLSMGVTQY